MSTNRLPCQVGDRVRVFRGGFPGLEGVVQAIDTGSEIVTVRLIVFGREVVVEVALDDLSPEAESLWMREQVRRFLHGREGVLESYLATWEATGFPMKRFWARVDRCQDHYRVLGTVLELVQDAGWQPGHQTDRELTEKEWAELSARLGDCQFWQLALEDWKYVGFDGLTLTLEGTREGRYHRVTRWSSGIPAPLHRACVYLARLAAVWPCEDD